MTMTLGRAEEIRRLVDLEQGVVGRAAFTDQELYQLELEQIFARAWNFVVHESQIPNTGDFFLNYIGEDRVIAVRAEDGSVSVLLNSCRHRGNAVCRAEEGNASSFMCTYHGWTYDLKGKLVGVPGFKEVYHEELDRDQWGLIPARVASYKGFVFACLDAEAPELDEYLGEAGRLCLDVVADQGEMQVIPGLTKYTINANWKFPTDNTWDYYHGQVTHASVRFTDPYGDQPRTRAGDLDRKLQFSYPEQGVTIWLAPYGHVAAGGHGLGRRAPHPDDAPSLQMPQRTGNRLVFPNLFLIGNQMELRVPKGPGQTEVWMFTFVDKHWTAEQRERVRYRSEHSFAPAGFHEQDDGENWDQSTAGCRGVIAQRYPLHYGMNVGRGEVFDDGAGPQITGVGVTEHPQMWMYKVWAEMLAAPSWADLRANPPYPPARM